MPAVPPNRAASGPASRRPALTGEGLAHRDDLLNTRYAQKAVTITGALSFVGRPAIAGRVSVQRICV